MKFVDEIEIDSQRKKNTIQDRKRWFTHLHRSLFLSCKIQEYSSNKQEDKVRKKYVRWNTNKKGGWQAYKNLTSENTKLDSIADSLTKEVKLVMQEIDRELTDVISKSCGKVKTRCIRKVM